jgi:5-methylthioadenosine/S-adenosylhomocysteine deaminase
MPKLLIKNVELITDGPAYPKKYVGIQDQKIAYIGTAKPAGYEGARVIDGLNKLLVPGFVNAHTHASMTLFRSYADDLQLMDWLQNMIWPAEAGLTPEDCYWGTKLAILEMLKSGTTAFADMYFFMDETARCIEETGIRASIGRCVVSAGCADGGAAKLQEAVQLYKDWHGKAEGRITVMLQPHAPYTCSKAYLKQVVAAAEKLGSEIHMHLSETQQEVKDCVKQQGLTPIAYADSLGILDQGALIAHAVWATPAEIALMARKKARVAHNPQSNLKLASGIAPVTAMLDAGVTVALGTDGASSNNNLDMLEECRLAALLHKGVNRDPLAIPAKTALAMATVNGAKALGYDNLGRLEVGCLADLVLYDMDKPHWHPRNDRVSLLVYAANAMDTDTVIVNGRVVLEKGQPCYIDTEKVYAECEARSRRLMKA